MKKFNLFFLLILFTTFFACRSKIESERVFNNATQLAKGPGVCACSDDYYNSRCPNCVKLKFMDNLNIKTYVIKWTLCNSDDPLAQGLCNMAGSNLESNVRFCYGTLPPVGSPDPECALYMTIDNVPPCVYNCVGGFPYCVKLKANCVGNAANDIDLTLDSEDSETGIITHITWTITGDPIISICCKKSPNPSHTYQYCCTGQTN